MPSESEQDALSRSLLAKFEEYVKLSKKVAPEIMNSVSSIDEVSRLADTISAHLQLKLEEKQDVLEMVDVPRACRASGGADGIRHGRAESGKAHPWPGQEADGEEPARVLSE